MSPPLKRRMVAVGTIGLAVVLGFSGLSSAADDDSNGIDTSRSFPKGVTDGPRMDRPDEGDLNGPKSVNNGVIWNEIFADDFSGSSVDESKWNVFDNSDYGKSNREDQCYFKRNITVSDGSAKLTAKKENVTCGGKNPDTGNTTWYWTSGYMTTRQAGGPMKFKFKYGYAEASIKLPKGNPYWPAFWLVGPSDGSAPGWPKYGEFDVMEVVGITPDAHHGTFHYDCNNGSHCQSRKATTKLARSSTPPGPKEPS